MAAHPSAESVQVQGCGALCHLAGVGADAKSKIVKLGGVESVRRALRAHAAAGAMQSVGHMVLTALQGTA